MDGSPNKRCEYTDLLFGEDILQTRAFLELDQSVSAACSVYLLSFLQRTEREMVSNIIKGLVALLWFSNDLVFFWTGGENKSISYLGRKR